MVGNKQTARGTHICVLHLLMSRIPYFIWFYIKFWVSHFNTKSIIPSIPIIPNTKKLYSPIFDCEGDTSKKRQFHKKHLKQMKTRNTIFLLNCKHCLIPCQNFKYETAPERQLHRRCFLRITTRPDTGDGAVYISAIAIHSPWLFVHVHCNVLNYKLKVI